MIEMEEGQCIIPIDLPNGEYAGTKNNSWSRNICADNEAMTLTAPDYIPTGAKEPPVQTKPNESTGYFDMREILGDVEKSPNTRQTTTMLGSNHMVSMDDNMEVQSAYNIQKGKNQANSKQ